MLFRALVLEGVAGSGKSSLLRALLTHPLFLSRAGRSSIVLTEHHTQRVLEGLGPLAELRVEDNLSLLQSHVDYLSGMAERLGRMTRWKADRLANPCLTAVIERFHFTHVLNYAHLEWQHVADLDLRLAEMGVKLCLVTARPDELRKRLASRGPSWGTFLSERGQRSRLTGAPSSSAQASKRPRSLQQNAPGSCSSISRAGLPTHGVAAAGNASAD